MDGLSHIQSRKALVLFTDGIDTCSRLADAAVTLSQAEESDALIYVIQYDTKTENARFFPDPGRAYRRAARYLTDLCTHTGGRMYQAASQEGLAAVFLQIAEELRHQYTLTYYPLNQPHDGSFRSIRVKVDKPGAKVRSRNGFRSSAK
jgi:Ca-activated chloride channel family protein